MNTWPTNDDRVAAFLDAAVANGFTLPDRLFHKEMDGLDVNALLDEAGIDPADDRIVIPLIDEALAALAAGRAS